MRKGSRLLLAASIAFGGYVIYLLASAEPVKVIQSRLGRDGDRVWVAGAVRNTASAERAIDLEVRYYDRGGRPLGADTISLKHLAAGGVREFSSPPHRLAGVGEFSLYLNNGRNPYGN